MTPMHITDHFPRQATQQRAAANARSVGDLEKNARYAASGIGPFGETRDVEMAWRGLLTTASPILPVTPVSQTEQVNTQRA